ncbi:hypothetical protein [Mycoplasma todarodis]|uniref:Uncharacterized protein n=1 Tax=Mycoplasma todarodis TaxID=1937191 RepID=A0A4R0XM97_9MOLU|nr:hypothetical protein [Mycoplasma todarodis]TCG11827.1 hypothetical protein C4B25_00720 [Mycoplasma todarodis]
MATIIIFSLLTFIWPVIMTITLGKKKIIQYIVGVFITFFLVINTSESLLRNSIGNGYSLPALFSILIIISLIPMFYFGYKRKCWTKQNLKESFGWLWTLYLIILSATIIRLFINHINSDTIAYARNSIYIREGTLGQHGLEFWYKTPTYYHVAALIDNPVDFFTIYGEVLQVILFSIALNLIVRNIPNKTGVVLAFVSVLVGMASVYALSLKTSGMNWTAVSIALLFILASRKNIVLLLLIPFSMSVFSFSPMLILPLSVIFIIILKRWTLKELIFSIMILGSLGIFMVMNMMNVNYKLFTIFTVMFFSNVAVYFILKKDILIKVPNKEIENPLYRTKLTKLKKFSEWKHFQRSLYIFAVSLFLFSELIMILYIVDVLHFAKIVGAKETTLMLSIPIAIFIFGIDAIRNKKLSYQFGWTIAMVFVMVLYAIVQLVPGVLPYLVDRVSLPYSMAIILVCLLRVVEMEKKKAVESIFMIGSATTLSICNVAMITGALMPSTIYSPPSTNVEMNYRFVTKQERKDILDNMQKHDVIYSDIAISTIREVWDEHAFFDNSMRKMFFPEMRDRLAGISEKNWNSILVYNSKYVKNPKYWDFEKDDLNEAGEIEFKKDVENKILVKKEIEYYALANSIDILKYGETSSILKDTGVDKNNTWWDIWDKQHISNKNKDSKNINVFMFRRKKYADLVAEHYKNKYKIERKTTGSMYIVRLK